jgi:hypothetical protein
MAKSDLLKEAIADAKAVKETALANAKIALQEAFQPRIKSMLETELMSELEDDELEMDAEMMAGDEEMDAPAEPMDDMGMEDEGEPMDVGDIEIDTDMDGEIDFTGDIMSKPGADVDMEDDMGMEAGIEDEEVGDMGADMDMEDDMDLEEIIRELEEGIYQDETSEGLKYEEPVEEQVKDEAADDGDGFLPESVESNSIDELIEAILAEEDEEEKKAEMNAEKEEEDKKAKANEMHCESVKEALGEAYDTVTHLKSVINEVNLLNAKLLYTNKLFRNFDLNEGQKMKVIENFDRAANTREAKLVFSTLAESFQKPSRGKRKVVKESKSLASKPVATTAPSKQTTQVLSEGFEQANRWKKLAGLIK